MSNLEFAIDKELNKEYIEAVKQYEKILEEVNKAPIEVYINLAFLYWIFATDFSFRNTFNIPSTWGEIGGERYSFIIKQGLSKYPKSLELHFWKKYFPYRHYDDDFTQKECERLINEYNDKESIVPYFFLYLFDKEQYKEQRDQLLKQCDQVSTAKYVYIKSIIE